MPTVIDSLVVSLGFDTSPLTQGANDAGKAFDSVAQAADAAAVNVAASTKEAAAAGSKSFTDLSDVSLAALSRIVVNTFSVSDSLKKLRSESEVQTNAIIAQLNNLKGAGASTAKELKARGGQAAEFFGQIQNKVLGLAAAYLGFGAVKSEIVGVTNATADMGRAASVAGVDLEKLSAFGNLIARNGGNAAQATAQVQGFIGTLEQYKLFGTASDQFKIALGTIGYAQDDTPFDVLDKAAVYAGQNKNDPAKVSTILSGIGITDNATLSELLKGPKQYNADLQESLRLGVADKGAADAARDLQEKFKALGQAVDQLARHILTKTAPLLDAVLEQLTDEIQGRSKHTPIATIIGGVVGGGIGFVLGGPLGAAAGAATGATIGTGLDAAETLHNAEHPTTAAALPDSRTTFPTPVSPSFAPIGVSSKPSPTNPGNIRPPGQSSGYLVFASVEGGVAAIAHQLQLYQDRDKLNTLRSAISRYAPASDHNDPEAYAAFLASKTGFGIDQALDFHDPATIAAVVSALTKFENNKTSYTPSFVQSALGGSQDDFGTAGLSVPSASSQLSFPGASSSVAFALPSAQDSATSVSHSSSSTSEINIDTIVVNTQATDAPGIASSIKTALQKSAMADQANTGLR